MNTHRMALSRWRILLSRYGYKLLVLSVSAGACLSWTPAADASTDQVCKRWFKQKKYEESSRCFIGVFKQLEQKPNRSDEDKEQMGASLRNAALSLAKAAASEPKVARAAYLREKSVSLFNLFLNRRDYLSATQKRYTIAQRDSLKEKIGYARLTVASAARDGQIQIAGYRFSQRGRGQWSQKVRPGMYTITLQAKGETMVREVRVEPGQPKVVRFALATAPKVLPVPPRPRLLPWIVIGAGTVAAIVGGSLLGVAFATKGTRDAQQTLVLARSPLSRTLQDTQEVRSLHDQANTQLMSGVIIASVGLAAAGTGLVLFFLPPSKTR